MPPEDSERTGREDPEDGIKLHAKACRRAGSLRDDLQGSVEQQQGDLHVHETAVFQAGDPGFLVGPDRGEQDGSPGRA